MNLIPVARVAFYCAEINRWKHGTAWRVRTDKWDGNMLITARHVLRCTDTAPVREEQLTWPAYPDFITAVNVEAESVEHDLALLSVWDTNVTTQLHKWELADASTSVNANDDVRHITTRNLKETINDPDKTRPFVVDGVVAWSDDAERIHTAAASMSGESGGLIVNADMEAIGLITGGYPSIRSHGDATVASAAATLSTHFAAIRQFLIDEGYLNR